MRIELPADSWASTHRAQDDAHTLTLPALRPAVAVAPTRPEDELLTIRVSVRAPEPVTLTLTF
ncbi:hypothetical protein FN976_26830 [Caenimonas sedimenti]|uniref:Uncharacterized protein n=1 Tax=Caenimonas sedimenti TaxID=2596921 RepID=A0A562ZFP5_9BURK|nr:hypothetical protein [Caenimonas sedimenti]TWO66159.1 hypothetical protein FN976_26830 [Caenimonas sedimenti]